MAFDPTKYGARPGAPRNLTQNTPPPDTQDNRPGGISGFVKRVGEWGQGLARDTFGIGTRPDGGAATDLYQNTVGSKSMAGVVQLPGRVVETAIRDRASQQTNQGRESLAQVTTALVKKARSMPAGPQRDQLEQLAMENMKHLASSVEAISQLEAGKTNIKQVVGTAGNAALTAATFGSEGVAAQIGNRGLQAAGRIAEGAATGAGFQAASNLASGKKVTDNLGTAAIVGGAIPAVGTVVSEGKRLAGKLLKSSGEHIQMSVIRPTAKDLSQGFKVENIRKHGVGGSLQKTIQKTNARLNQLDGELEQVLASGTEQGARIDLNGIYQQTEQRLLGKSAERFGSREAVEKALGGLQKEVSGVTTEGGVDLVTAQTVKRAAGHQGAWYYGVPDPDAQARELVYDAFYNELKKAIENAATKGRVAAINKEMSELIPIHNAAVRRLPVAARNNLLSLTDTLGLFAALADPKALAGIAVSRLSKSGTVGDALAKAGDKILTRKPQTNIGVRVFGR